MFPYFCLSVFLLSCSFYCLINFECLCVLLLRQRLLCCRCVLKFCGICSAYWLSGSSLSCLASPQVCVIVGRLSGLLAANRATLASLCVYETAGMCLVPPGRGRPIGRGGWRSVNERPVVALWGAGGHIGEQQVLSQSGRWLKPPKWPPQRRASLWLALA